jgi:hypothetical protein
MVKNCIDICERMLGSSFTNVLRWVLLLPVSVAAGVLTFLICNSGYPERWTGGEEAQFWMSLLAPPAGGFATVRLAIVLAPAFQRTVAILMAVLCIMAGGALVCWAHQHHGAWYRAVAWYVAVSYALSAGITAAACAVKGPPVDECF